MLNYTLEADYEMKVTVLVHEFGQVGVNNQLVQREPVALSPFERVHRRVREGVGAR